MPSYPWTCPHCSHAQTVIEENVDAGTWHIDVPRLAEGSVSLAWHAVGCSNLACRKLTLRIGVHPDRRCAEGGYELKMPMQVLWRRTILPESNAKPQPDFIPPALREDYREACLIRDLSPKAAATLARRCLQGMIRDFAGIVRGRLVEEIHALKTAVEEGKAPQGVTADTVEAIDHVRGVGNIGAHMEKDIDLIVPVDPGEAQALIELIEMLFDEWYVARERRRQKLAKIAEIGTDKKQLIADGKSARAGASEGSSAAITGPSAGIDAPESAATVGTEPSEFGTDEQPQT